jgi:Na+/H+ antiporter NhaD/arsenite permease-like protein
MSARNRGGLFSRPLAGLLGLITVALTPGFALASSGGPLPSVWAVLPFVVLLGMIATGPLFYHHFWEKNYPAISIALGLVTVAYYGLGLGTLAPIYHEFVEYISFIALLASLFVASGAILIEIDKKGTPLMNVVLLLIGSVLANFIGTTGASVLLIRPYMRMNRGRIKAYHVIFFIFTVSNIGGGLTPIGDPPLFMGFLRGVDFFWVFMNTWHIWMISVGMVLAVFFVIDTLNARKAADSGDSYSGKIKFTGLKSAWWLLLIILAVFIDPNVMPWVPDLKGAYHLPLGIREIIMFAICFAAYKTADKTALRGNDFNFEPIKEVAYLFIGIFLAMVPALQLIAHEAKVLGDKLTPGLFYWGTGTLSAVLDNTPTYLNFFAAMFGKFGLDHNSLADVKLFEACVQTAPFLMAISVGAVFFGAMTYIGNGPNFMVKAISDQNGVKCPSFFGYVVKYAIPVLLPIFIIIWALFFRLPSPGQSAIQKSCPEIHQKMIESGLGGGHSAKEEAKSLRETAGL